MKSEVKDNSVVRLGVTALSFILLAVALSTSVSAYTWHLSTFPAGTLTDLSATDTGGWMVGSQNGVSVDSANRKAYYIGTSGEFGVYSIATNTTTDLMAKDVGDWFDATDIYSIAYNPADGRAYVGGYHARFGAYNPNTDIVDDLRTTDTANWMGSSYAVNALTYDPNHNRIYMAMSSGEFGYYNYVSNVATDLSATDTGNWLGTTSLTTGAYSTNGDFWLLGTAAGGLYGRYDYSTGITTDLSATDTGNWIGTTRFYSMAYDSHNHKVYLGLEGGKLGVYDPSTGITSDLSATDTGNWFGSNTLFSMTYDSKNDLIFIGLAGGKFGEYNPNTNVATDLSTSDPGNWLSTLQVRALDYDPVEDLTFLGASGTGYFGVYSKYGIDISITINSVTNTTIGTSSHTFNISNSPSMPCTLNLSGLTFADSTNTQHTWAKTLSDYNWTVFYKCTYLGTSYDTPEYWLEVSTCTPSLTNTSWSSWADITGCQINDTKEQERSRVQYDSNYCGTVANETFYDYQEVACNYCSYSIVNTSWSSWQDYGSCLVNNSQEQQSSKTEYDENYDTCYAVTGLPSDLWNGGVNNTYWQYQYVYCDYCTPSMVYTNWTAWQNYGSCLPSDEQEQKRTRVHYDENYCDEVENTTETQYQWVACDYCTPDMVNGSWSDWYDTTSCRPNNTKLQNRSKTLHDVNECGEIPDETFYEERSVACVYSLVEITINSPTNTIVSSGSQTFDVTLSNPGNCSLYLDGVWYPKSTVGTHIFWVKTLTTTNHTNIKVRCDDEYDNPAETDPYWLMVSGGCGGKPNSKCFDVTLIVIDTIPPIITINSPQNFTSMDATQTFNITTNKIATCTLVLDGVSYAHGGTGTEFEWTKTLSTINHTVYYECYSTPGYEVNSSDYWIDIQRPYDGWLESDSFNVPATGYNGTVFQTSWSATFHDKVANVSIRIPTPLGCSLVLGSDYSSSSVDNTTISSSKTFVCLGVGTYHFYLNITYDNVSGTQTEILSDSIVISVYTPGGGTGGGVGESKPKFQLKPQMMTPVNDYEAEGMAKLRFSVDNKGSAFLGYVSFELMPQSDLGEGDTATNGWCSLKDYLYNSYTYPANIMTSGITVQCDLPKNTVTKPTNFKEKVCVTSLSGVKSCSIISIPMSPNAGEFALGATIAGTLSSQQTILLGGLVLFILFLIFCGRRRGKKKR